MKRTSRTSTIAPLVILEDLNGRTYTGATLDDALQNMRASAWFCTEATLREYMEGVASRTMKWNGSKVRTDTVDGFIADMVAAGVLVLRSTH